MQDITRKYKVVNYVDDKNLEWNTEPMEAMELEHVMSQAAPARHATDPRKLKLTITNTNLNSNRCSGRNTRTPVHQETTRKLNCQTSRAEEVCLKNACITDVHRQVHMTIMTTITTMTTYTTKPQGLAHWWLTTLDES